jgi:hypothetical protein
VYEARRELEARLDDVGAPEQAGAVKPGRTASILAAIAFRSLRPALLAVGNRELAPKGGHGITGGRSDLVERLAHEENRKCHRLGVSALNSMSTAFRRPQYANAVKRSPTRSSWPTTRTPRWRGRAWRASRSAHRAGIQDRPEKCEGARTGGHGGIQQHDSRAPSPQRKSRIVPPNSDMAESIRDSIADAQQLAGGAVKAPPAPARASAAASGTVSGTVQLAPALAARVAPGDTDFISARAVDGPRAPLAVTRREVRELPATFTR